MDRVLIEAGSVLNRARPLARKVVILLTAGRQTQGVGVPSLNRAMESIRSHSAKMFVIGIGQQVDQTELRPLTSDIFDISGFNTLRRHSIGIAKDIKNKTGTLTLPLSLGFSWVTYERYSHTPSCAGLASLGCILEFIITHLALSGIR